MRTAIITAALVIIKHCATTPATQNDWFGYALLIVAAVVFDAIDVSQKYGKKI